MKTGIAILFGFLSGAFIITANVLGALGVPLTITLLILNVLDVTSLSWWLVFGSIPAAIVLGIVGFILAAVTALISERKVEAKYRPFGGGLQMGGWR